MQCGAKGISSFGKHDDVIKWKLLSALLAICAGNSPVSGEFPSQRPVTRNFDIFFDLRLNKRLTRQSWGWWFETVSRPLWRQCNEALLLNKVTSTSMVFDNNPNAFIVPQEQGTLSHGKAFYIIFLYDGNLLVIRGFPSHKGSVVCGIGVSFVGSLNKIVAINNNRVRFNTLRHGQNFYHFADDIFKCIF